ncbi:hypothetical protein KC349_g143 [Hortaea werneckii]|nr:hypothetical protein KC349_g143 [Hortaea werneckii]
MAVQVQRHLSRPSTTLTRQHWNVTENVCDSVMLHVKATRKAISPKGLSRLSSREICQAETPDVPGLGPAQKWLQRDWACRLEAIYSFNFFLNRFRWLFLFSQPVVTFSRAHIVILTAFSACMYLPIQIAGEQTNFQLSDAR